MERLRLEIGAEACGNVLGRGVRLLSRETALLDRKVRPVACGVEIVGVVDAGVLVNREEPVLVGGEPLDPRALEQREGDDRSCGKLLVVGGENERSLPRI